MARVDLAYARSLLRVAEPADLVARGGAPRRRAAVAQAGAPRRRRRRRRAPAPRRSGARRASSPRDRIADDYRRALSRRRSTRLRARAAAILRHEIDIFGVARTVGARIDWRRDPLSGKRCDGDGLFPEGVDPKGCWELARGGHLVELAAAPRCVHAELAGARARRDRRRRSTTFLDDNPVGRGIHYASPLELAMRAVHWLAAVELAGGARALPRAVRRAAGRRAARRRPASSPRTSRIAASSRPITCSATGSGSTRSAWRSTARRTRAAGVTPPSARSPSSARARSAATARTSRRRPRTTAGRSSWCSPRTCARAPPIGRRPSVRRCTACSIFVRSYVGPDGCEPAFGDGDDARLFPIVPHAGARARVPARPSVPRSSAIPSCARPARRCRRRRCGWPAPRRAACGRWLPATPPPRSASFPTGGVHVLRSARVAGRAALRLVRTEGRRRPRAQRSARASWPGSTAAAASSTPAPAATPPTWCCAIASAAPRRTRP